MMTNGINGTSNRQQAATRGLWGMTWNSLNSDVHATININETDKYA